MLAENKIYFNFKGQQLCNFNTRLNIHPYESLKPSTIRQRLQFTLENTFTLQRYFPISESNTGGLLSQLDETLDNDEKFLSDPLYAKIFSNELKFVYRKPQYRNDFVKLISYKPLKITDALLGVIALDGMSIKLFSLAKDQLIKVSVYPYRGEIRMKFVGTDNRTELDVRQLSGEWLLDSNCLYPVVNSEVQDPLRLGDFCEIDNGFIKL